VVASPSQTQAKGST